MKIVITGSLGHTGRPLTKAVLQKGHTVTVISSNPQKQKEIEALGATAAIGSVLDVDFLVSAFTGADAVYAMVPPNFTVPDSRAYYNSVGNSYAQAITLCGVKHVVQLSSWGAHLNHGTGFILGSHDVEGVFNALQHVTVTYLRPCSFYYNLYHYTDMIKAAGFIGTNYGGEDRLVMVSPVDIAAAAAEELVAQATGSKIRYVASDERSCNEIATALGTAIGNPDLKWITFTDAQVQERMEQNGLPATVAAQFVELNASIHNGLLREDYDRNVPVFGKVKLEDFAKDFAAAFKST